MIWLFNYFVLRERIQKSIFDCKTIPKNRNKGKSVFISDRAFTTECKCFCMFDTVCVIQAVQNILKSSFFVVYLFVVFAESLCDIGAFPGINQALFVRSYHR